MCTGAEPGSGTEADPYLIKTKADLEMLADAVNVYKQNHRGDFFKMTNDIDLELDKNFTGIATQTGTTFFNGTFDGGNHTVHQLYLDPNSGQKKYTGLFGLCGAASTIKNVRVAADSKINAYRYGASTNAILGGVVGSNLGTVETALNTGSVVGNKQVELHVESECRRLDQRRHHQGLQDHCRAQLLRSQWPQCRRAGCRCLHPGHALHRWQHNSNQGGAVAVVYLIYS